MKAVMISNNPDAIRQVYGRGRKEKIERQCSLYPSLITRENWQDHRNALAEAEVVFSTWGMWTSEELLNAMPCLKAVFYAAGATDSFSRPLLKRNILVCSAWRMNAIAVAEFCTAQIILSLKGYFRNSRELIAPEFWTHDENGAYVGPGAYGERVALIGGGAISTLVQRMLGAYQVEVVVVPSRKERRTISLEDAFRTAMVVSNHLPDRSDNVRVIDGELLSSMRPGATFINTGRGAQVDEVALVETMRRRPDLTALLDVCYPEPPEKNSPLYSLENIRLSSHIAGSLNDELSRMADCMLEEFERFSTGREQIHRVFEEMLMTSGT